MKTNRVKDYFTFNRRERNGVFVLLTIIVGLTVYINIDHHFATPEVIDFSAYEKEIKEFIAAQEAAANTEIPEGYAEAGMLPPLKEEKEVTVNYFNFNPNGLSKEKWQQLGLKEWQVTMIHNYEAKGGSFRKKEDLQKMYSIDEATYERLAPYIDIPIDTAEKQWNEYQPVEKITIELNKADTTQLQTLYGIGPVFSRRIVKYRDKLGGFIAKQQLAEVYGLEQKVIDGFYHQLVVDTTLIQRININTATVDDLKAHPYISWNIANSIASIRDVHGAYETLGQIKKSDLINEELYLKLAPYLTIE